MSMPKYLSVILHELLQWVLLIQQDLIKIECQDLSQRQQYQNPIAQQGPTVTVIILRYQPY